MLEALTHRLAECPPDFLLPPRDINVIALVADHFRVMQADPSPASLRTLMGRQENDLRLMAVATWLLHEDWFLSRRALVGAMWKLLAHELRDVAEVLRAHDVVHDADRREEFVRICLKHLGLRPKGETVTQATDRLNTLDSAERLKVVRQTRDAEARARKIRERMAAEAARVAAARYSPE
jgi:hypothetical protein